MDVKKIVPERDFFINPETLAWASWGGYALAVIGIILSFYFYFKSQKKKRPYCLTFTHTINGSIAINSPDLKITYRGKLIDTLSITKMVFWNAGNQTIDNIDIPKSSPFISRVIDNGIILNCRLEYVKNHSNSLNINVNKDENSIDISFDYLDRNDGFILEIIHTGVSDSSLRIDGVFKGSEPLVRRSAAPLLSLPRPIRKLLASDARFFIGLVLIAESIFIMADAFFKITPTWLYSSHLPKTIPEWIVFVALHILFIAAGVYLLRTKLPAGFNLEWK